MIEIRLTHVKRSTGERTCIGQATIDDDGTGGAYFGNYDFCYAEVGDRGSDQKHQCVKVRGFERKKRNVWDLLHLALSHARGHRNR